MPGSCHGGEGSNDAAAVAPVPLAGLHLQKETAAAQQRVDSSLQARVKGMGAMSGARTGGRAGEPPATLAFVVSLAPSSLTHIVGSTPLCSLVKQLPKRWLAAAREGHVATHRQQLGNAHGGAEGGIGEGHSPAGAGQIQQDHTLCTTRTPSDSWRQKRSRVAGLLRQASTGRWLLEGCYQPKPSSSCTAAHPGSRP